MTIEIYWGSGSPFAWSVLFTLEYKKADYLSRLIEFSKKDHQTPDFLKMNPRGKVPVLKEGEFCLYESLAIMQYIENKYPSQPLFGETPEEKGLIQQNIYEIMNYLTPAFNQYMRPIFMNEIEKNLNSISSAKEEIHCELMNLERKLDHSTWLMGNNFSAADIYLMPIIQLLLRTRLSNQANSFKIAFDSLNKTYPYLHRWMKRMEELPEFEKTYPPHWKK